MTEDKSSLDQFLASIWGKISAFMTSVIALAGFAALWKENFIVVGAITFGLVTAILTLASFAWRTEIVQPAILTKRPLSARRKRVALLPPNWLLAARIALGSAILGWVSWGVYLGYHHQQAIHQLAALDSKVAILIAEIDGPDPKSYRVSEELTGQLKDSLAAYTDTIILASNELITEQQGSDRARALGTAAHADIVLWGYYGATATNVRLVLHVENLQPDKIPVFGAGETIRAQAAIAALDSFTFQQDVGTQMAALVLFISGYARFQAEDYPAALERFDQALAQPSWADEVVNRAEALFFRGLTHFFLENWEQALGDYAEAIPLDPHNAMLYNNRSIVYIFQGEYAQAAADASEAIRIDPGEATYYNNRGSAYSAQGQYTEAFSDYAQAITLSPRDPSAYYNRANTYRAQGQYAKAIADYTEAVRLNPGDVAFYNNRAIAYRALEQYPQAMADYGAALRIDPYHAETYYNRGISYAAQGQYAQAIADYGEAIRLDPAFAAAYDNRGNAYKAQGKLIQAIADYDEAIRLAPHIATAYYNRGNAYQSLEQHTKAIADYTQAIRLEPGLALAYNNRGNAYRALGQYPQAIADYSETLRLAPDEAAIYFNRGIVYQLNSQAQLALADYQQALNLTTNPDLRAQIQQSIQSLSQSTPAP